MTPEIPLSIPECIHDGEKQGTRYGDPSLGDCVSCVACGAPLYRTKVGLNDDGSPFVETTYIDDIYTLLYTRAGRLQFVKHALKELGWQVPKLWDKKVPS